MASQDLRALFEGSDEESLLYALHRSIRNPRNAAQRTFCDAWDAMELVNGDGFEDYAAAFGEISMPQVQPIFSRVLALIPPELRQPQSEDALLEHLRTLFEELKELAYEFYDASAAFVPKVTTSSLDGT